MTAVDLPKVLDVEAASTMPVLAKLVGFSRLIVLVCAITVAWDKDTCFWLLDLIRRRMASFLEAGCCTGCCWLYWSLTSFKYLPVR